MSRVHVSIARKVSQNKNMVRYAIADDAPFVHEIIKNFLPDESFKFIGSALNGPEAIELVRRTLPDVIFLDFVMPLKNGIEVAKEIKTVWPELKIIGMSTLDEPKIIQDAKNNGMDDFVGKPFTKESILLALINLGIKIASHQRMTS